MRSPCAARSPQVCSLACPAGRINRDQPKSPDPRPLSMTHTTRLSIAVTWLAIQLVGCASAGPVLEPTPAEVVRVRISRNACGRVLEESFSTTATLAIPPADLDRASLERLLPGRDLSALDGAGCVYL